MIKKDIHKIDNFLINTSHILLTIAGISFSALFFFKFPNIYFKFGELIMISAMALIASLPMLFIGKLIRYREDKVIDIWDIIEMTVMITIRDIELNTGYGRDFIRQAITLINKRSEVFYIWDENSDIIMEGKIHSMRVATISIECDNCGASASQETHSKWASDCSYCGASINVDIKKQIPKSRPVFSAIKAETEFSAVIFILLLIVFWPVAILYAVWKSGYLNDFMKRVIKSEAIHNQEAHENTK